MTAITKEQISLKKETPKPYDANDISLAKLNVINCLFSWAFSTISQAHFLIRIGAFALMREVNIKRTIHGFWAVPPTSRVREVVANSKFQKLCTIGSIASDIALTGQLMNSKDPVTNLAQKVSNCAAVVIGGTKLAGMAQGSYSKIANYLRNGCKSFKDLFIGTVLHAFNLSCEALKINDAFTQMLGEEQKEEIQKVNPELEAAKREFGFTETPTCKDVERKWRKLALKYHPDTGGTHEDMVRISAQKELLKSSCLP